MIKRLEQVAALVVAAGLAIVSYWLFFSWAQGGDTDRHRRPQTSGQELQRLDRRALASAAHQEAPAAGKRSRPL